MALVWGRLLPGALILGALAVSGGALVEQAQTHESVNASMRQMLIDLREARRLTEETGDALRPLRSTAETVGQMNVRIRQMVADVSAMNAALERVTGKQRRILSGATVMARETEGIAEDLLGLGQRNRELGGQTALLAGRTEEQAEQLTRLSVLTDSGIAELRRLNGRFEFLRKP